MWKEKTMKKIANLLTWFKYKPYDEPQPVWLELIPVVAEKGLAFGERCGMVRAICIDGTCFGHYRKEAIYPRDV
jgi:hypothetical protein